MKSIIAITLFLVFRMIFFGTCPFKINTSKEVKHKWCETETKNKPFFSQKQKENGNKIPFKCSRIKTIVFNGDCLLSMVRLFFIKKNNYSLQ